MFPKFTHTHRTQSVRKDILISIMNKVLIAILFFGFALCAGQPAKGNLKSFTIPKHFY